jgi:hypothetical protein
MRCTTFGFAPALIAGDAAVCPSACAVFLIHAVVRSGREFGHGIKVEASAPA